VSAFGGVMASNQIVDEETVEAIGRLRLDVLIAPGFTMNALNRLSKRRNLRLISAGSPRLGPDWEFRSIPGGFLVQEPDIIEDDSSAWKCVTKREATSEERDALAFAWAVVRNVKSNAIVLAKPGRVTGVGAGQPNRVESVRIAVKVAAGESTGSVLASDAFFPFADGIQTAAEAGVTAIAQPGGSVRDQECIDAANNAAIAMLFTGVRHFRH
jgi:phosphoribosylaminoimidazolecarboxamide formyltransferase/IMP cyclohydrolase